MEFNNLGNTGLKVSQISLGSMNFAKLGKEEVFKILDTSHDLGINLIDTANAYNQAEKFVGEWLSNYERENMIINTKVGWPTGENVNDRGLSRTHIRNQVQQSLENLQTDYIDIYQPHYYDGDVAINHLVHHFHDLVVSGNINHIGAPLFTRPYYLVLWHMKAIQQGLHSISTKLMTTSLLSRGMYDGDTRHIAKDLNLGLITFGSIGGGLLSGKYHSKKSYPAHGKQMLKKYVTSGQIDPLVDRLIELASELDISPAKISLAWVLSHDFMSSTVIGVRSAEQLRDIVDAINVKLKRKTVQELTELSNLYSIW